MALFSCFCSRRRNDSDRRPVHGGKDVPEILVTRSEIDFDPSIDSVIILDDHSALCTILTPKQDHGSNKETLQPSSPYVSSPDLERTAKDERRYSDSAINPEEQVIMEVSAARQYDEPTYIDEFEALPEHDYNNATSVPFFSTCSATLGYPAARLLRFRLQGILCIPENPQLTRI